MPHKGSSGTSMGGTMIRVPQRWPDKNAEECPVCKAGRRSPCRDKRTNKLMYRTHTGNAIKRSKK